MHLKLVLGAVVATVLSSAAVADTIKVGVIAPLSGPFSLYGQNFKAGIAAYQALHGDKAAGHTIEFIYKDEVGVDPARAKQLTQELIVKDKVDYLGGVVMTPNAMAMAPLLEQGKTPLVIFNAATSAITKASPLIVRTSFTMWQNAVPMAKTALDRGSKKVVTAVSDYGPGIDVETAFKNTFVAGGGTLVESIRMPLNTTDFAPVMQRIKDSKADAVFAFLPSGPPTLAFFKAFLGNGLKDAGITLYSTGDLVQEPDLAAYGDAAIGTLTTYNYQVSHASPENKAFVAQANKTMTSSDDLFTAAVAAFDGAHVIYKMVEATGGQKDPAKALAAVKGMSWVSPRGSITIDPDTRSVNQTIYLREVAKVDGRLINKEIKTFPDQRDWGSVSP